MRLLEIKERDALIFAVGLTVFIGILTVVLLSQSINSLHSSIVATETEYNKAFKLYKTLKSKSGTLKRYDGDLLLFVQKLQKINGIKDKIVSVSAAGLNNGVRISLAGLNLMQLLEVFKEIENYSNIEISEFTIKKDFTNNRLVDVDMVLRKKA